MRKQDRFGVVVRADSTFEVVSPSKGKRFDLDELLSFVHGWLEPIRLKSNLIVLIDEEGLIKGKPENVRATLAVQRISGFPVTRPIVGDVVFIASGSGLGIPQEAVDIVLKAISVAE